MPDYNTRVQWSGDSVIITVLDIYHEEGISSTGRSMKVATAGDRRNPKMHFTFNAYKPLYHDMNPSQGQNASWETRGNSVVITINDITRTVGQTREGYERICHMQQGIGNNVVAQLTGWRPRSNRRSYRRTFRL